MSWHGEKADVTASDPEGNTLTYGEGYGRGFAKFAAVTVLWNLNGYAATNVPDVAK